jgi:hypothetical protein
MPFAECKWDLAVTGWNSRFPAGITDEKSDSRKEKIKERRFLGEPVAAMPEFMPACLSISGWMTISS